MPAGSSSSEGKLSATGNSVHEFSGYKCQHCSKVFKSMRARGGHQSVHRRKKPLRRKKGEPPMNPILAAVLAHHISSDEEDDNERPPPPPPPPPAEVQPSDDSVEPAPTNESSSFKPQEKQAVQLETKDLLGLWNPRAGFSQTSCSSSAERITLDLFPQEKKGGEKDDLDLELKLVSDNYKKASLRLKLGI